MVELSERFFIQNSIVQLVWHLEFIGSRCVARSYWRFVRTSALASIFSCDYTWNSGRTSCYYTIWRYEDRGRIAEGSLTRWDTGRRNSITRRSIKVSPVLNNSQQCPGLERHLSTLKLWVRVGCASPKK